MKETLSTTGWRSVVCLCVALLAFSSSALHAQFDTAVVLGTVRDGSGGGVSGATIVLKNLETGITAETQTDENGSYQFFNVRVGAPYQITAEGQGFSTAIAKDLSVAVNARQRVDFTLQVGTVSDEVIVTERHWHQRPRRLVQRQRPAQHGQQLPARSGRAEEVRPAVPRRRGARDPRRGLQRAEQDELRRAQR
jgi:hypothetical protein